MNKEAEQLRDQQDIPTIRRKGMRTSMSIKNNGMNPSNTFSQDAH